MSDEQIPTRRPHFQIERLDDNVLLYHPGLTKTIQLNESASLIWELCDGQRSIREIADLLSEAYPDAAAEVRDDVAATLRRFAEEGAVELMQT
jgi:pyrroloquinoline quinone biosynthesis protein D